jgi:tripartite-type tricarboxylate transporter receptor subunit TctC
MMKRRFLQCFLGAFLGASIAAVVCAPALAQDWPSRPIQLVVPFGAGGSSDIVGRLLAAKLREEFGQAVVVDNRTGAGGMIGCEAVARSKPDGYTLLLSIAATHAIQPALGVPMSFDAVKDFAPIGQVGVGGIGIAVAANSPYRSMKDLIDAAKAPGSNISYGTGGVASGGHLLGEAVKALTGVDMIHIPYRGGTQAMTDVMAGQVQVVITDTSTLSGYARNGQARVIAVGTPIRSPALPDTPTLMEQGIAFGAGSWFALFAPAGTPAPIVAKLNAALNKFLDAPDVKQKWQELGLGINRTTPEQFAKIQADDIALWTRTIKTANIKVTQQ